MTEREVLKYVLEHRARYDDPAIRVALRGKGVPLAAIDSAMFAADHLAEDSRKSGKPIDIGPDPEPPVSWGRRILAALLAAAVTGGALVWLASRPAGQNAPPAGQTGR